MDAGKKSIYNIDVPTAMRRTAEEWDGCPRDLIQNGFTHWFYQGDALGGDIGKEVATKKIEHMQRDAHEHGVTTRRADLQHFLSPEEEDSVLEQIHYDHLVREVAGFEVDESIELKEQSAENEEEVHTVEQQFQSHAIARAVLERHAPLSVDFCQAFYDGQCELRLEKQHGMKQTTILDQFAHN